MWLEARGTQNNDCKARVEPGFCSSTAPLNAPEGELFRGLTNLPVPRGTQRPCNGSSHKWAECVDQIFLSWSPFPGLFDHFITVWGIETTNLICQIIDFQGTCNGCCYCVLLLNPKFGLTVMKHLVLLKAKIYTWVFFTWTADRTFWSGMDLWLQEPLSGWRFLS